MIDMMPLASNCCLVKEGLATVGKVGGGLGGGGDTPRYQT